MHFAPDQTHKKTQKKNLNKKTLLKIGKGIVAIKVFFKKRRLSLILKN